MAHVILVRHCESEANRAGPEGGGSDSPLSARGRAQAEAVRRSFAALADTLPPTAQRCWRRSPRASTPAPIR